MIRLPCRPVDDLVWRIDPPASDILWFFDLGLDAPFFPLDDPMHFEALTLALKQFSTDLWPKYQEATRGAILYRGGGDFSDVFLWTEKQKENYTLWRAQKSLDESVHARRLFAADAFAHYFQMLSHRLPDELSLFLCFELDGVGTTAQRHRIASKERFEHFQVALQGLPSWNGLHWDGQNLIEAPKHPVAVLLPEEESISGPVLFELDQFISRLEEPFRVVHEAFLTEEWEGIDRLYVLGEALSVRGKRKLAGFQAAGGEIEEIRGRGIRTPGLLVPNQSR